MRKGSIFAAIAAAFAGIIAIHVAPQSAQAQSSGLFARTLLYEHNSERERKGLQPLSWSGKLAGEAQQWANKLARENKMYHSTRDQRGGAGENLWMGTSGYYTAQDMIGSFLAERQYFRAGEFPNVSSTGKWADVGHYTQIVWPTTEQVGCAVARGQAYDFLVCRYWPTGNVFGTKIS